MSRSGLLRRRPVSVSFGPKVVRYGRYSERPSPADLSTAPHTFRASTPTGALDPLCVPVEVKNRRSWIYPNSAALYQLLAKAAALQIAQPDVGMVPVLVCRRAHITARRMAEDLGFFVISAQAQFVAWPRDADERFLEEVREGLGYFDLTTGLGAHPRTVGALARALPTVAIRSAERWRHFAPELHTSFRTLRLEFPQPERTRYMQTLRAHAKSLGADKPW
jgi:hypothetical protein